MRRPSRGSARPGRGARAAALLLAGLLVAFRASADEVTPKPKDAPQGPEETVKVKAEMERVASDPTAFATIIRPDEFADRITTLTDLLRDAVGVHVTSLGGEFATVSIRGSSAEQVVVYLDGVPLNRALGGAVNLADVPLAQIDSIEIYRGFTPASLASASIGGAILIHSKAGGPGPRAAASVSWGSFQTGEITASTQASGPRGDFYAGADAAGSDGDFVFLDNNGTPHDPTDDEETIRVNNDFRRSHLTSRGALQAGQTRITLGADFLQRDQGVPGIDASPSLHSRYHNERLLLSAQAERPGLAGGRLLLRGGLTGTLYDEEYDGAQNDLALFARRTDNRVVSRAAEAGGTLVPSAGQAVSFLIAARREEADLHNRVLDPSEIGRATRDVTTVVLEDQIALAAGRLLLDPSIRHERYAGQFEPGPSAGIVPEGAPDDAVTTGRVGLRFEPVDGVAVRANAGTFLRLPDVTELFGDQGAVIGNPALQPERGRNADAGVAFATTRAHGALRQARVETAFFATDATNLIVYESRAQSAVVATNIGAARIRGVELTIDLMLGPRLGGTINAVHQSAVDDSGRFTSGNQLPGRPRDEVSAGAGLVLGPGRAAYQFTYVGPNYINGVNTESGLLDARYLHDLSYRFRLRPGIEITLQARNIFDERAVDVARFPLPGRSFEARLQWTH